MTKIAFPTDTHYPFQDDRAVELAQKIVSDFKPDILIRGSDALDFYKVSFYQKFKDIWRDGLQEEIDAWEAGERAWSDAAPDAERKPFLIGNHEARLRKYLAGTELEGLHVLDIQNLLNFSEFGIRLAHNNEVVVDSQILIKHGDLVRKHSAYTARGELEKEMYGSTILTGHTHRMGAHYATTRSGVVAAYECGCLCDVNPGYVKNPNWQQGLTLATTHSAGPQVEQIPFYKKGKTITAHWRDKEYSA